MAEKVIMNGWKGFEPGMVCRGKQYQENSIAEEPNAKICKNGIHFCEEPFEVLNYYPIINDNGDFNEFAPVEALDECDTDDNKKFCTKRLKIGAKVTFKDLIKAGIDVLIEKAKVSADTKDTDSGNYAKIGSSGNYAQIGSSGDRAQIVSKGAESVIAAIGFNSMAKAAVGSWITLAEYGDWDGKHYPVKCVKTECVDGERIKADTWYGLVDGEFKEID